MLTTTSTPSLHRPVPARADALLELRHATRSLHERLDAGLPLSRDGASLVDYTLHLYVLRNWQLALAPWLLRTASDLSSVNLIDQDLADAPADASVDALGPIDLNPVRAADDGSDAFCWGIAYVLEGSRLGGQVLFRRLHERLAPHPLRYLHQRLETGPSWADTVTALRRELGSAAARRSGCLGAVAAFEVLLQRFEQAGGLPS